MPFIGIECLFSSSLLKNLLTIHIGDIPGTDLQQFAELIEVRRYLNDELAVKAL